MNKWLDKDFTYNWHPYTQMTTLRDNPPLLIERAEGIKLYDSSGQWYYDTISSWWCNIHGHGHPRLKKAISSQLKKLDHTLFAGFTHKPAIELAERLVDIAPAGLNKVFFSDNGSTAVEVALKMSLQYWRNNGHPEKKGFIALDRAYHGDTVGCMSVSGEGPFVQAFTPLMFPAIKVPTPYCYRCPLGLENDKCNAACAKYLEDTLREQAANTAAIILEPLLMGAGGMIIYPAGYLTAVSRLARKYDVHLILDEVATGFGRTGTMFACEQAEVVPKFLCLSKGITGGLLPLAATLTTQKVFDAFCGPAGSDKTFFHGHTYTANPVGCSAALASLDIFEKEKTLEHVQSLSGKLSGAMNDFREHPLVGDVRTIGTVAALELVSDKVIKTPLAAHDTVIRDIYRKGLELNLILRPLSNVIYLFLPLCTTADELDDIIKRTKLAIKCS
ncbi:MAG TPA: adenosylmethionine--8-amino-7-oxononanoate transaminase [Smithellaceae bacterium]|nr:adenosylmethionine--8-amino-7-oxononanoate transaminase [Smithellaceae bacterium]